VVGCEVNCPSNAQNCLQGQIEGKKGVKNGSSGGGCVPPPPAEASTAPLPCQNSNNWVKNDESEVLEDALKMIEKHLQRATYAKKQAKALAVNTCAFIDNVGIDYAVMLEITFDRNQYGLLKWSDKEAVKEAKRRLKAFERYVLRDLFGEGWISIIEPQTKNDDCIHFHQIRVCQSDVRTGFKFENIDNLRNTNACKELRNIWDELNEKCEQYMIGRCRCAPIRTKSKTVGDYVGKYLTKTMGILKNKAQGCRSVEYSRTQKNRRVFMNMKWSWSGVRSVGKKEAKEVGVEAGSVCMSGAYNWRQKVGKLAEAVGAVDLEDIKNVLGKKWAYHLIKAVKANIVDDYIENCRRFYKDNKILPALEIRKLTLFERNLRNQLKGAVT
jgi:hypothetical protein